MGRGENNVTESSEGDHVVEVPVNTPNDEQSAANEVTTVQVSSAEAAVLVDFRKAKKDAEEATEKFEDVGDSQDSWDDILNSGDDMESVEMFNKFHGHFAGITLLDRDSLLRQVKTELREAKGWKESDMQKVRTALVESRTADYESRDQGQGGQEKRVASKVGYQGLH